MRSSHCRPGGGGPPGAPNYGLLSLPLIVEPIDSDLKMRYLEQRARIDAFMAANPGYSSYLILNTEKYGVSAGGFPWQDNLQAAGELSRYVRATYPAVKVGCYAPCPRKDFYQQAGDDSFSIHNDRKELYLEGLAVAAKYLSKHVHFFVLDGYVPWRGPTGAYEGKPAKYFRDPSAGSQTITKCPYARYPALADDRSIFSSGYVGAVTWLDCYRMMLEQQRDAVRSVASKMPLHIWTSSSYLPNGMEYNTRERSPNAMWEPPVWQVFMREAIYRSVLDTIAGILASDPQADDAVVMLEGWSDEKQAVVDWFASELINLPITVPPTPSVEIDNRRSWASAGGAGALLWQGSDTPISPAAVHPYLDAIVSDYRPM